MQTSYEIEPFEKLVLLCNILMSSQRESPLFDIVNKETNPPVNKQLVNDLCWLLKTYRVIKEYTPPRFSLGSTDSSEFIDTLNILATTKQSLSKKITAIQQHLAQHRFLSKNGKAMQLLNNHGLMQLCSPADTILILFNAIFDGDLFLVKQYAKGLEFYTHKKRIPFNFAVTKNQLEIASHLLDLIEIRLNTYNSVKAAIPFFNENLQILVKRNEKKSEQARGFLIEKLLHLGANPNLLTEEKEILLHIAISNESPGIVKMLCQHGANLLATYNGQTPIQRIQSFKKELMFKMEEALWSSVVPAVMDGESVLQKTIDTLLFEAITHSSLERVKLYANKFNCNPSLYNSDMHTHHRDYGKYYYNYAIGEGWGPVERAATVGNKDIIHFLLQEMLKYENINANKGQLTLTRLLFSLREEKTICQLIEKGADITAIHPEVKKNYLTYVTESIMIDRYATVLNKHLYTHSTPIPKPLNTRWANIWEKAHQARHYEPLVLLCNIYSNGSKHLRVKELWCMILNFLPGYFNFDENYVRDTCCFVDIGRVIKESQSKRKSLRMNETALLDDLTQIDTAKEQFQVKIDSLKSTILAQAPNLDEGPVKSSLIRYGVFPTKDNPRLKVLDKTQDITPNASTPQ